MTQPNHVETEHVDGRRLGRRPHDPARPVLRLADILTGATVPPHAVSADHFSKVADWGMYSNDRYGVCGPTSVANSRKLTTKYLTGVEQSPSQDDVYDLYRRSGNPSFDPATDADDNGVDMATMLSAVRAGGIGGTKCLGYAKVDTSNLDEVRAAIDIFGFVLLGVDLQTAQQAQTNAGLWDYKRSSEWGGHAVLSGAYTSATRGADAKVITWAEVVGVTDAFWAHQVDEAWVVIWPEHVGTVQFQQGVDAGKLNDLFKALTGEPGPLPHPQPAPTPTPVPPAPTPAPSSDTAKLAKVKADLTALLASLA